MSQFTRRVYRAWLVASLAVVAATAWATFDTKPVADATTTVLTQARDLGILGGIVIAFMLIVGILYTVDAYLREKASRRMAEALAAQSLTLATSVHNMIEHGQQMSAAADVRISKFIAMAEGRPCFMTAESRDLFHEAHKAALKVKAAAIIAETKASEAVEKAAELVVEEAVAVLHNRRKEDRA